MYEFGETQVFRAEKVTHTSHFTNICEGFPKDRHGDRGNRTGVQGDEHQGYAVRRATDSPAQRQLGSHMERDGFSLLISRMKVNSKWISGPNMKAKKSLKLLKDTYTQH